MTEELDRAIERIMGVGIEAMGGDNLAVLLCSHFDDPDDGSDMDDTGWSETATNAYEEIKREIEGLFVPVREALATTRADFAALKAREVGYVQAMDAMGEELAAKDAEIARLRGQLADPNAVHVNLLRGSIARPTVHQMIHIYSPAKVRDGLETYARARLAGDTV